MTKKRELRTRLAAARELELVLRERVKSLTELRNLRRDRCVKAMTAFQGGDSAILVKDGMAYSVLISNAEYTMSSAGLLDVTLTIVPQGPEVVG